MLLRWFFPPLGCGRRLALSTQRREHCPTEAMARRCAIFSDGPKPLHALFVRPLRRLRSPVVLECRRD